MKRSRPFLYTACLVALLFAQQVGLWHAVWHASQESHASHDNGDAPAGTVNHDGDTHQASLCPLDKAFATVLAALDGSQSPHPLEPAPYVAPLAASDADCCAPAPEPASRGPPAPLLA